MKGKPRPENPLYGFFHESVHWSLHRQMNLRDCEDVENYLTALLSEFSRRERVYAIKDADGKPIQTVAEMLAEGDVRLGADSFDREREVHRHIGDFLLFWTGVFPESLLNTGGNGYLAAAIRQGSASYDIVSSFRHGVYGDEAPTFRKLSDRFDLWRQSLAIVRSSMKGFPALGDA